MAEISDDDLAFEIATNRSYLKALEERLSQKNPEISVTANERYVDNVPHGERASVGPLYGRVGLTSPDEDLGIAFYVGTRYLAESDWDHRVISWVSPAARALYDPYGSHELNAKVLVRRALTVRGSEVVHASEDWTRTVPAKESPFRAAPPQIPPPPQRLTTERTRDPASSEWQPQGPERQPPSHPQLPKQQPAATVPTLASRTSQPKAQRQEPAVPATAQDPRSPTALGTWKIDAPLLVNHSDDFDVIDIVARRAVRAAQVMVTPQRLSRVLLVSNSTSTCQAYAANIRAVAKRDFLGSVPDRITVTPLPKWLGSISEYPAFTDYNPGSPNDTGRFIKSVVAQVVRLCAQHSVWAQRNVPLREGIHVAYEVLRNGGLPGRPLDIERYAKWIESLPTFESAWGQLRYTALFAQLAVVIRGTGDLRPYDHVIVDQAHEIAGLEWELLRDHNPAGQWSLFGDMSDREAAQFGVHSWHALARRLEIAHRPGKADVFVIHAGALHRQTIELPLPSHAPSTLHMTPQVGPAQPHTTTTAADLEVGMRAIDSVRFALNAPRTNALTSVLSTLQPDQYRLVTQPPTIPLVIQGHPGTGKTIIAVHRAAYLVNPDRETRKGPVPRVLLLGPTDQYVHHVSAVVRELDAGGHVTVRSLPTWLAQLAGQPLDTKPSEGTPQDVGGFVAELAERLVFSCQRRAEWANAGRGEKLEIVYEAIRAHDGLESSTAEHSWPQTLPPFAKARGQRRYLPLLAELGLLVDSRRTSYDHVVVDEAQDVSELEWELIRAHNPGGRWTIVGDLNQRRRSDIGEFDWHSLAKRLGIYAGADLFEPEVVERGYRSTQPILDFANRLLPADARQPSSLQTEGPKPAVIRTSTPGRRDARAIAEAERLLHNHRDGTAAIITTDPDAIEKLLLIEGWQRPGPTAGGGVWARDKDGLTVRTPESARGVEFDGVVVVEPSYFIRQEEFTGSLYTSLTRANRELVIVHSRPLPAALQEQPGSGRAVDEIH